jgi:ABC-type multidrug transport system fused ATPase/permease subunit
MRVAASITCLFAAKCCNVIVPLSFKEVIDSFGGNPAAVASVALPVALLAAYASSRLMAGLFSELRSALFARVAQNAVRSVSTRLFNHVQRLDLECVSFSHFSSALLMACKGITSAAKRARFLASLSVEPAAFRFS